MTRRRRGRGLTGWLIDHLVWMLGSEADWVLGDLEERRRKRYGVRGRIALVRDLVSIGWWALRRGRRTGEPTWVGSAWHDVRGAAQVLRRRPAYVLGVASTLALGAGTLAATFALVDGLLLRPLPLDRSAELERLYRTTESADRLDFTPRQLRALQTSPAGSGGLGAYSRAGRILQIPGGDAYSVDFARVTPGFFETLAVAPMLGRLPESSEVRSGAPVVVLSEGLWRSLFAADPTVPGLQVQLDELPHLVIGVLPDGRSLPADVGLWRPLTERELADGDAELVAVARRGVGVSRVGFERVLASAAAAARASDPAEWGQDGVRSSPLREALVGDADRPLWVLLAASALVLLVAVANVTALQLIRGVEGGRDAAVRIALGASPSGVIGRLATEASLLALSGCAIGLLVAGLALPAVRGLAVGAVPLADTVTLSPRVALAAAAVTVVSTTVGALASAVLTVRRAAPGMRGAGGLVAGAPRLRALRVLVAGQVAITTVLIVSAGLLTLSLARLLSTPRGFDAGDMLAVSLSLSSSAVESAGGLRAYHDAVLERVGAVPGVSAVALAMQHPGLGVGMNPAMIGIQDLPSVSARTARPQLQVVSPSYFRTIRLPLVEGRLPPETPGLGTAERIVVNRTFANNVLGAGPWVGRRLTRSDPGSEALREMEVVGVAEDVVISPGEPPPSTLYASTSSVLMFKHLLVRVDGSAPADAVVAHIHAVLATLDPAQPRNVAAWIEDGLAANGDRIGFHAKLMSLFGLLGLALATVGVYGVAAYGALQRRAELGLRSALGASRFTIVRLALGRALSASLTGVLVGLVGAWSASRALSSLLFDVVPLEPVVYVAGAAGLGAVAMLAAVVPAVSVTRDRTAVARILGQR